MGSGENYATRWREATRLPSGLKNRARALIRHISLTTLSAIQLPKGSNFLRCLYCHYVFDDQKAAFSRLIDELTDIGTFIDTDTCIDMLEGRKKIDGRYFHLSFDDGFRNVFTNAIPILKGRNVPAIVFVPTSFIGADWERTKWYCLEAIRHRAVIETMTWDDLRELRSHGFEVGSHTRNHARFSGISRHPEILEDEISGSKQNIEQHLGKECKYISWPYGTLDDSDTISLDMTRKAGYHACFGAYRGSVAPQRTDKFSIPRHHFEVQWPLSHVRYFAQGNMES